MHDLGKRLPPFWGGVEVACSYASKVMWNFRKRCVFAPLFSFVRGTTQHSLSPLFYTYYVHLLWNIGINRTFIQTAEVLRDLLKLVKSSSSDLPQLVKYVTLDGIWSVFISLRIYISSQFVSTRHKILLVFCWQSMVKEKEAFSKTKIKGRPENIRISAGRPQCINRPRFLTFLKE